MRSRGSGLHEELARAHLRDLEQRAQKALLADRAAAGRSGGAGHGESRSRGAWLASALRAVADRLDRPATSERCV
jgi:hypothetical protein